MCLFCFGFDALVAVSEGDSTHGEVVRAQLNLHSVARKDSDVVHSHLSTHVSKHFHFPFVQLHAETRVWKVFQDCAIQLNPFFLIRLIVCFGFIVPSSSHVILVYR